MLEQRGPTFMEPDEIIWQHKQGRLDTRQGVVALARLVRELQQRVRELEEDLREGVRT